MWVWRLQLAELVLAALALLGCGMPVFVDSARRSIGAFVYGLLAVFAPALFPSGMRSGTGVSPHFEASVAALAAALWRMQRA